MKTRYDVVTQRTNMEVQRDLVTSSCLDFAFSLLGILADYKLRFCCVNNYIGQFVLQEMESF